MISGDHGGRPAPVDHFDVFPNEALGPFKLGETFWTVAEILKTHRDTFRVVDVSWDREKPAAGALLLKVDGWITLCFPSTPSPCPQILQRIDITATVSSDPSSSAPTTNKNRPRLAYGSQTLHSITEPLNRNRVSTLFGPTFQTNSTPLRTCYPGIGFEWSTSSSQTNVKSPSRKGGGDPAEGEQIGRISIFQDQGGDHTANLEMMTRAVEVVWEGFVPNAAMEGSLKLCQIEPGKSVALHWHGRARESPSKPYNIVLHHTLAQDILLDLGTPSRRYTKQDNRFEGMYGQGQEREDRTRARKGEKTWWNYFQLGLDFLVDDNDGGVIVKVMAHSNIPGTALFQRYARCPWEILVPGHKGETLICRDTLKAATAAFSKSIGNGTFKSAKSSNASNSGADIAAMTLDRTNEPGFEDIINIDPSRIVALDGIIIEEGPGGAGLASVLIC